MTGRLDCTQFSLEHSWPGTVSHPIRMCACRPILGFQLRLDTIFVDNIPLELGLICTPLGTAHLRDEERDRESGLVCIFP